LTRATSKKKKKVTGTVSGELNSREVGKSALAVYLVLVTLGRGVKSSVVENERTIRERGRGTQIDVGTRQSGDARRQQALPEEAGMPK